jgi:RNA polymerase sigma-70 factor (ECF subfamily)
MDQTLTTPGPPGTRSDPARAVDELYRAHADVMFRVAVAVVRDRSLAEDVVQESILKAWRHLDTFRGEGSQLAWLLSIVHNTAVSLLRRLRDTPMDPVLLPENPTEHVEADAEDRLFLTAFENALFDLDELSRAIVVLRELEDLAYEVIAEALDVPLSTVKTRLFRARHQLADRLADWSPA